MGMCFFLQKIESPKPPVLFFAQEMNVTLKTLTLDPLSFTIEDFFDKSLGGWDGWSRMNPEMESMGSMGSIIYINI